MKVLFVCTDNYTRSVIAEMAANRYIRDNGIAGVEAASAGIRADSDVSHYSDLHFRIMEEQGIDVSGFKRMMFDERCFDSYDVIIGMSELHRDYIAERYGRDILLFNEAAGIGGAASVTIRAPNDDHFEAEMRALVMRITDAMPILLHNLGADR